ncbi:ATP-binding protein [Streptomyces sp. NPDC088812]|uniref:ATP-binding protein n=1 Tax=Streptomyces sp. NPDC088812 TaxID=3365905 RepID=UPI0037FC13F4
MSVPASPSQRRSAEVPRASSAVPVTVLLVGGAAAGAAMAAAPAAARTWTVVAALVAWVCVAVTVVVCAVLIRRTRRSAATREAEVARMSAQSAQQSAESAHLVNVTLPALLDRLGEGEGAREALAKVTPPADPRLLQVVQAFASAMEQAVGYAIASDTERQRARQELDDITAEMDRVGQKVVPVAVEQLREGSSADTVLARLEWPPSSVLRTPTETFIRELAHSERRAAAAQAASAKALSRVQAKTVSMLADLREMQERHGEEVFGDLLKLDHSTSQLGLMTDRLALLMGGRSSRAWNKPIVMESILRGAAGRIAAYQRVRLHCSSNAAVSGFAAEGVMHLLAELADNAANFSPPIDEVHIYVEEHSAGLIVTIEDSGLKMADAAMRRAEEAVAGRVTDLASLQGTRLGLAVVGRLALKYGISVNYRPSSRGGTGVVVLLPLNLLAQRSDAAPRETAGRPAAVADAVPGPREPASRPLAGSRPTTGSRPTAAELPGPAARPAPAVRPAAPAEASAQAAPRGPVAATPNGLPVRAPGRTMAEAERERDQRRATADSAGSGDAPGRTRPAGRDAGSRFGAFHSGRTAAGGADGPVDEPGSGPLTGQ